jgi:hypothetical protein
MKPKFTETEKFFTDPEKNFTGDLVKPLKINNLEILSYIVGTCGKLTL